MQAPDFDLENLFSIFENFITDKIESKNYDEFLIAYSGGIDSSVLLDCFLKLSRITPIKIRSLHVNHGISEEANRLEDHCMKICKEYGINHISKKLNLKLTANIEEQCRQARYKELCENCQDDEVIITAHHEEDQIETRERTRGPKSTAEIDK